MNRQTGKLNAPSTNKIPRLKLWMFQKSKHDNALSAITY